MNRFRKAKRVAVAWSPLAAMALMTAPIWLFGVRAWWEMTHALLTKPWTELFRIGGST